MTKDKTETDHIAEAKDKLLDAALSHVMFDGWSAETLRAAIADSGVDPGLAHQAAPRGAIDLAAAFHRRADAQMAEVLRTTDLSHLRYSERIAWGVRKRLELVAGQREAVRRGVVLFSLPHNAPEGSALIWGTVDAIWSALGDTSEDLNWYTKRATLAAVYGATVLYWLGDESDGFERTWAFLDRRIADVMQIETIKAKVRDTPFGRAFAAGPGKIFDIIRAPKRGVRDDLPGYTGRR